MRLHSPSLPDLAPLSDPDRLILLLDIDFFLSDLGLPVEQNLDLYFDDLDLDLPFDLDPPFDLDLDPLDALDFDLVWSSPLLVLRDAATDTYFA